MRGIDVGRHGSPPLAVSRAVGDEYRVSSREQALDEPLVEDCVGPNDHHARRLRITRIFVRVERANQFAAGSRQKAAVAVRGAERPHPDLGRVLISDDPRRRRIACW